MFLKLLEKVPLSQGGKVAVGTALCLGLCAIPMRKSAWRGVADGRYTHTHT